MRGDRPCVRTEISQPSVSPILASAIGIMWASAERMMALVLRAWCNFTRLSPSRLGSLFIAHAFSFWPLFAPPVCWFRFPHPEPVEGSGARGWRETCPSCGQISRAKRRLGHIPRHGDFRQGPSAYPWRSRWNGGPGEWIPSDHPGTAVQQPARAHRSEGLARGLDAPASTPAARRLCETVRAFSPKEVSPSEGMDADLIPRVRTIRTAPSRDETKVYVGCAQCFVKSAIGIFSQCYTSRTHLDRKAL
jgi:hypothetical protein